MKFHSSVIFVKDIEKSKDFYTRLLNQQVELDFGKNIILGCGLTIWEIRPEHIITKQLDTNSKSNRFELYFETGLIDEMYRKLKKENVKFLHGPHEEPWGQRTTRFFDPDGHLVEIGEPLEVFVKNMIGNGLTLEQVSDKSGIPLETVKRIVADE